MSNKHSVSAGGLVFRDGKILLVQVNYGSNKRLWMIPGGIVEAGESLEEAVIRELKEETGISAVPTRIIGVRSGVRQVGNSIETGIYVVFEMDYLSGETNALDINEISGIKFESASEILENPEVIDLTKEFIKAAIKSSAGLYKSVKEVSSNTKYISYNVYAIRNEANSKAR
ncbi:NUDIX domain-containing protein [Paenibacillus sp. NPDC056579]|uniref:NUDIX domain-containing protein n=1 Tax=Paenibacillus sp. NPDC056579 TaxID=3345871 RepID=UPI0036779281